MLFWRRMNNADVEDSMPGSWRDASGYEGAATPEFKL
jgi:hypothetical protein